MLRSLAYNAGQVPNRYKINRNLTFDVDPVAFASGGFSDVRRGTLGDKLVAVKVLRMAQDSNVVELQKVGSTDVFFSFKLTSLHSISARRLSFGRISHIPISSGSSQSISTARPEGVSWSPSSW